MAVTVSTDRLKVPGATIYFETRGSGPTLIMIPGGPADAGYYNTVANALADRYTVVAYDPRGNSRSVFDDVPVDQDLDVHGDDAARLIESLGAEPVLVFGSSGGAQIGLNLAARYPQLVHTLVAHEPPCVLLLPDSEEIGAGIDEVVERYENEGTEAAMRKFMEVTGIDLGLEAEVDDALAGEHGASDSMQPDAGPDAEPDADSDAQPGLDADDLASFERMDANMPYFFQHGMRPIPYYVPQVDVLSSGPVRVVVATGTTSAGQLANRSTLELAKRLGTDPETFPGGHDGYFDDPQGFAVTLSRVLTES